MAILCAPALAQGVPADRAKPQALVESLHNALALRDYPRAWSHDEAGAAEPFDAFAADLADAVFVHTKVGEARGAAGRTIVLSGCYATRQVQLAAQGRPTSAPIRVATAQPAPAFGDFDTTTGECPTEGL